MAIAAALSGVMAKLVFTYNWSWFEALMFGSIISATDPVAVVSLLNELGKFVTVLSHTIFNWISWVNHTIFNKRT